MKTISLAVNDELADRFNKMSTAKKAAILKILIEGIISIDSLNDPLHFNDRQAEQQSISEKKLAELLKKP